MIFRNTTRVIVIFAATAALGQSAQPGTTAGTPILNLQSPAGQGLAGRKGPGGKRAPDPQGLPAIREQVEGMESTLSHMRVVLKQMHVKADANKATNSLTKENLDMWELMVSHLDKELQQLRLTLAAREDMEARRADLYRQADVKAAAEAQSARAAQTARFAEAQKNANVTPTPTVPTAATAGTTAGQTPTEASAPDSASPK